MIIGFVLFWFVFLFLIGAGIHLILKKAYSINRSFLIFFIVATAFLCVVIYVGVSSLISLTLLMSQVLIVTLAIAAAIIVVTLEPIFSGVISRVQNAPFELEHKESGLNVSQVGASLLKGGQEEDLSPFTLEGKVKKTGSEQQVRVVPRRSSAAKVGKMTTSSKIEEKNTKEWQKKTEKRKKKKKEEAIVTATESLDELLNEAYKALDSGEYKLALEGFQKATKSCSEDSLEVRLLFERARIFDLVGKGKNALAELKKAKKKAVQIGDANLVTQSEELLKFLTS